MPYAPYTYICIIICVRLYVRLVFLDNYSDTEIYQKMLKKKYIIDFFFLIYCIIKINWKSSFERRKNFTYTYLCTYMCVSSDS